MFQIMSRDRMSWTFGLTVELLGLMFWKVNNSCVDPSFKILGEQNINVLCDSVGVSKTEAVYASSRLAVTCKAAFACKDKDLMLAHSFSA